MSDEFITPEENSKNNRTVLIIGVTALVLACLCCGVLALGWFFGDAAIELLRELGAL